MGSLGASQHNQPAAARARGHWRAADSRVRRVAGDGADAGELRGPMQLLARLGRLHVHACPCIICSRLRQKSSNRMPDYYATSEQIARLKQADKSFKRKSYK